MSYEQTLHRVLELQGKIKEVHPLFGNSYPIAIVEGDTFLVFDIDDAGHAYHLVRQAPTPMPIPVGVRAAFELECYDNKIACVVTGEVFDTLDGYVTIFHEFVHCHQSSTCELKLKQNLQVARQAMASGNFMWEIEHLFPYSSLEFTETYTALLHAVEANAGAEVLSAHRRLVKFLQPVDADAPRAGLPFEYLVWQEWKEGFARLLENRLQRWFGLPENHYGRQQPYHRITFYEGGARLIDALSQDTPELTCGRPKSGLTGDLEKLFWRIQHA